MFWHDPDQGLCSSMAIIKQINYKGHSNVFLIEKEDGCELEVYKHELS